MSDFQETGSAQDPDRLGRTGGRPRRAGGFTRMLGKALGKGWMKGVKDGAGGKRADVGSRGFRQRVIVKAIVVRHGRRTAARGGVGGRMGAGGRSRGGASLARHVRYLGRDGTSEKGDRSEFYDRDAEGLNARQLTRAWDEPDGPDRHHFRLIISPEKGEHIADLKAYVRTVMERVGQDLASPSKAGGGEGAKDRLEWIAINHFNTDQPHAHVLIRGVTGPLIERSIGVSKTPSRESSNEASGESAAARELRAANEHRVIDPGRARVLILSRQTISHGFRQRAEEVATLLLGERSLEEVRHAREQEVGAERWTGLDRQIARQIELQNGSANALSDASKTRPQRAPGSGRSEPPVSRIDIAPDRLQGVSAHERGLLVRRLQSLRMYGLATPTRGSAWRVEPDFRQRLIALGARGDIIKTLYGTLGAEAGRVVPFGLADRLAGHLPQPLTGRVIDHGRVDELSLDRFLVIEDAQGLRSYAKVPEGPGYERVQVGSQVVVGQMAAVRAAALDQVQEIVSGSPDGIYSREVHAARLKARPDLSAGEKVAVLDAASMQLGRLARRSGSGVEAVQTDRTQPAYRVAPNALDQPRLALLRSHVTDLRMIDGARELPERTRSRADRSKRADERFRPGRSGRSARRSPRERDDLELGD